MPAGDSGPSPDGNKPTLPRADGKITLPNRWDHIAARWGYRRMGHRVEPGLYAAGSPTGDSPVFVTANYTLSFDALRSGAAGIDAYILVLDTEGINVWCAAGAGKFSTDELVRKIEETGLGGYVDHRRLILPQLGASGVSAHEVALRTGFRVEFGPVRAEDLPAFLEAGEATEAMRLVRFPFWDRVSLIPVELVHIFPYFAAAFVVLLITGGLPAAMAGAACLAGGTVLFPMLLPYLPTESFSTKGLILGGLIAFPFAIAYLLYPDGAPLWLRAGRGLTCLLTMTPAIAFMGLNFTGATPLTSRSGVRREIMSYIPVMAWMFGAGLALGILVTASGIMRSV